jgi:hypothetical protein
MGPTIFTLLALLGCGFLLYTLFHWVQDTHPSLPRGSGYDRAREQQLHLVPSRRAGHYRDDDHTERELLGRRTRARQSELSFYHSERVAYQRIAKSLISRKKV